MENENLVRTGRISWSNQGVLMEEFALVELYIGYSNSGQQLTKQRIQKGSHVWRPVPHIQDLIDQEVDQEES